MDICSRMHVRCLFVYLSSYSCGRSCLLVATVLVAVLRCCLVAVWKLVRKERTGFQCSPSSPSPLSTSSTHHHHSSLPPSLPACLPPTLPPPSGLKTSMFRCKQDSTVKRVLAFFSRFRSPVFSSVLLFLTFLFLEHSQCFSFRVRDTPKRLYKGRPRYRPECRRRPVFCRDHFLSPRRRHGPRAQWRTGSCGEWRVESVHVLPDTRATGGLCLSWCGIRHAQTGTARHMHSMGTRPHEVCIYEQRSLIIVRVTIFRVFENTFSSLLQGASRAWVSSWKERTRVQYALDGNSAVSLQSLFVFCGFSLCFAAFPRRQQAVPQVLLQMETAVASLHPRVREVTVPFSSLLGRRQQELAERSWCRSCWTKLRISQRSFHFPRQTAANISSRRRWVLCVLSCFFCFLLSWHLFFASWSCWRALCVHEELSTAN